MTSKLEFHIAERCPMKIQVDTGSDVTILSVTNPYSIHLLLHGRMSPRMRSMILDCSESPVRCLSEYIAGRAVGKLRSVSAEIAWVFPFPFPPTERQFRVFRFRGNGKKSFPHSPECRWKRCFGERCWPGFFHHSICACLKIQKSFFWGNK